MRGGYGTVPPHELRKKQHYKREDNNRNKDKNNNITIYKPTAYDCKEEKKIEDKRMNI